MASRRAGQPALEPRRHGAELRRRTDAVGQLAQSCEETLESASATGYAQNHGYIFEVPVDTEPGTPAQPVALRHLGRFAHEAVAVDPATGVVYETEDQGDGSGFYRFVPSTRPRRPGDLAAHDRASSRC